MGLSTLKPREAGKFVSSNCKRIRINMSNLEKLGEQLIEKYRKGNLSLLGEPNKLLWPQRNDNHCIDWLCFVNTLNFSFWTATHSKSYTVDNEHGYYALCAAVNRALKNGIPILNPNYYSTIDEECLFKIMKSTTNSELPLLSERVQCLHEVGIVLKEKFSGTFINVVRSAENSAMKLLDIILENFACFRDEAVYNFQSIGFYKRAQILIADIWICYQNQDLGYFHDINELTMFADYRVPQILLYYNIFNYTTEFYEKLQNDDTTLENGDEEEVEIRGCSIHAVSLLSNYTAKILGHESKINDIVIDNYLWEMRRELADKIIEANIPFHKTRCIYY